jgi:hypothetical protein
LFWRNSISVIIWLIPFPPEYSSAAENTSDSLPRHLYLAVT